MVGSRPLTVKEPSGERALILAPRKVLERLEGSPLLTVPPRQPVVLEEGREALIQPQITPASASQPIPKPLVGELVRGEALDKGPGRDHSLRRDDGVGVDGR